MTEKEAQEEQMNSPTREVVRHQGSMEHNQNGVCMKYECYKDGVRIQDVTARNPFEAVMKIANQWIVRHGGGFEERYDPLILSVASDEDNIDVIVDIGGHWINDRPKNITVTFSMEDV